MHLGPKLQMPIRLILACAIFLGAAQVHPSVMACSLKLCGNECPMHKAVEPKPGPVSCCAKKKKQPEPAHTECKCTIKAGKPATPSVLKAPVSVPSFAAILVQAPIAPALEPLIVEIAIPAARCHGPPGPRTEAPDLGRAPPVI